MLMQTTLVQRLGPPCLGKFGYGLPPEFLEIFSVEEMDPKTFPTDATPRAIEKMVNEARQGRLVAQAYTVTVQPDANEIRFCGYQPADVTFYLLGTPEANKRAKQVIDSEAGLQQDKAFGLNDTTLLHDVLSSEESLTQAWIEANNAFFFSSNYDMFVKMADLLVVEHDIKAQQKKRILQVV